MAKKKARAGRPAKKKTVSRKNNPKRTQEKARLSPKGPAEALSAHGLAKWQPQAGDMLVTQSVGSMTYSGRSWRKSEAAPAAPKKQSRATAASGSGKKRGRPSKHVVEQAALPVKRGPGRPRKALEGAPMQQAKRGQRGKRVIEEVVIEDIDALDGRISDVA